MGCALATGVMETGRVSAVRPVAAVLLATACAGCTGAAAPVDAVGEAGGGTAGSSLCRVHKGSSAGRRGGGTGCPQSNGRRRGCLYTPMGDVRCTCMHKSCSRNRSG